MQNQILAAPGQAAALLVVASMANAGFQAAGVRNVALVGATAMAALRVAPASSCSSPWVCSRFSFRP